MCGSGSTTFDSTQPIPITATDTIIEANRCQAGSQSSAIVVFNYQLAVADVSATGNATSGVMLATTTQNATIHYTTDGTAVDCTSGTTGTQVTVAPGTTINAIGCRVGFQPSTMQTFHD